MYKYELFLYSIVNREREKLDGFRSLEKDRVMLYTRSDIDKFYSNCNPAVVCTKMETSRKFDFPLQDYNYLEKEIILSNAKTSKELKYKNKESVKLTYKYLDENFRLNMHKIQPAVRRGVFKLIFG